MPDTRNESGIVHIQFRVPRHCDPCRVHRPPNFKDSADKSLKVTDLIDTTTNQWDRGKVHAIVNPDTREDILKIKLSNVALRDRLIWKENKANKFSMKTSYQVALRLLHPQTGEHSLASMDRKMWKRIWSLNFPPKVRNFIWRALTFCQLKQIWFKRKCEWTPSVMCV